MASDARHDIPIEVMQAIAAGRKIEAIKLLRARTGIGLMEAKELVDSVGRTEAGFGVEHRAAPRNDTGIRRLILVLLLLSVAVAGYFWVQG